MWQIEYHITQLVSRHRGTLPIILTCPHDGGKSPPNVPERTGRGLPSRCHFTKTRDLRTRAITTGVAQRLLELCGEAPYVVIAEFNRKHIDANRSPDCAYEVAAAKSSYDEYHQTLRGFLDEVRAENGGSGLLFDIHGTAGIASDPADFYLGTAAGASIARLLKIDTHAMSRRRSLGGLLAAAGYAVSLNPPTLGGGYTVETYGTSNADGIDAIQVEIAATLRKNAQKRAALIEHLAYAICNLVDRYASGATFAAFQSVDLLDGGAVQNPIGRLHRRAATKDSHLRLGGDVGHRGRLELRHDPTSPRRAGVLVLYDESGKDYFLWVDNQGVLRIAPSDPGSSSGVGKMVGEQP
jgi:N-formylglutamate amidohydrolase